MSVCSGKKTQKNFDKPQSPEKTNLKNTKTTISSKSNPFVKTKKSLQYFNTVQDKNSLLLEMGNFHRSETLKIQEEKIMKKFIENYEFRPTFFLDQHDNPEEIDLNVQHLENLKNNVNSNKDILRESDIVFEIINKQKTSENFPLNNKHSTKELEEPRTNANKNWGVILNVFKVINNMKCVNTKSVKSLTDIDRTLNVFEKIHRIRKQNGNYVKDSDNDFSDDFEEITKQIKLFDYVSSGCDENIEKIQEIVKDDKMRNMYDHHQKEYYFINKKNFDGLTALYMACQNGHYKVVDVLLKNHADHLIKCGTVGEDESILDVSIRWGHVKIVEHLLKFEWPDTYLKSALKMAINSKNEYIAKLVKKAIAENRIKHRKSYSCCFG